MKVRNTKCIGATNMAILVESDELDEATWIPQSVISDDSEVWEVNQVGTLVVEDWWARKKGWW